MALCQSTTAKGEPCKRDTPPGKPFCQAHDPERREQAQAARSLGGQVTAAKFKGTGRRPGRPRTRPEPEKARKRRRNRRKLPDTPEKLSIWLAEALDDVRTGEIDHLRGQAISSMVSTQLRVLAVAKPVEQRKVDRFSGMSDDEAIQFMIRAVGLDRLLDAVKATAAAGREAEDAEGASGGTVAHLHSAKEAIS